MKKRKNTHGLNGTRIQSIWFGIKQRCLNENSKAYKYYGGRGIKVCQRWSSSLELFLEDMGHPPELYTIERIDNNGNYEPGNCKWASRSDQQKNRRNNKFITYNGITQTCKEWAVQLEIPKQTIYQRYDLGWPPEKILSKEKLLDKSGLKLGGIANGIAQANKTHCKHGHAFSNKNTYINKNGSRTCRKCKAIREAVRRSLIKAGKYH